MAAAEGPDVTFYDFVGVKSGASLDEINKAYRKKSRLIHPDKAKQQFVASRATQKKTGKKPGVHVTKPPSESEIKKAVKQASDRFARLGIVSNILRGPSRDRYDHFLKNGFPTWRGTGYYYSRFRPGLGSVLFGLFLFGGGVVHYGALVLGYKRQRDFMDRYIRHARRTAWGDETAIGGIPGLGGAITPPPAAEPDTDALPLNRKQKRQMEKENKKEKTSKKPVARSGTATPDRGAVPTGPRKRVTAENGKVLIVDSSGNVFLEEEIDGEVQEFLLDIDEIQRPSFRNTAVYRLPIWIFDKIAGRSKKQEAETGDELDSAVDEVVSAVLPREANIRKRSKKNGTAS